MIYCQQCGKPNEDTMSFCTTCGGKLITGQKGGLKDLLEPDLDTRPSDSLGAGLVGAILIIVGFFSPWFNVMFYSVNAYTLVFGNASMSADIGRFTLLILPVTALLFIIHSFIKNLSKGLIKTIKFFPIILLLVYIAWGIYETNENSTYSSFSSVNPGGLLRIIGLGIWCTLIGAITMCFHKEK